jgi:hypothetical protein
MKLGSGDQRVINKNSQKIRVMNRKLNKVRLSKATTEEHRTKIRDFCDIMEYFNIPFYTEPIFLSGYRPDVYLPLVDIAVEAVVSEKKESIDRKRLVYDVKKVIVI